MISARPSPEFAQRGAPHSWLHWGNDASHPGSRESKSSKQLNSLAIMQGATLMFIDRHGDRTVIERGNQPAAPQASGTHISRASLPRMPILHSTPRPLSPAPTEGHITALPDEILIKVVDELAQGSLPVLGRCSRVCRRFYAAVASARRVSLSITGELPIEQLYIPYHAVRTGDIL